MDSDENCSQSTQEEEEVEEEEARTEVEAEPGLGVRIQQSINGNKAKERKNRKANAIPSAVMLSIRAVECKDWANFRTEWKTWKFTLTTATENQGFSEEAKRALLILRGGTLIQELAMDGPVTNDEINVGEANEPVFQNLIKRIENRISLAANKSHDMARLSEAKQTNKETIEAFARRLRELARLCNMNGDATEMILRNRIFDGAILGNRLAELSLPNPSMSTQEIVSMGTRIEEREQAKSDKKEEMPGASETINAISRSFGNKARGAPERQVTRFKSNRNWESSVRQNPYQTPYQRQNQGPRANYTCNRCGWDCRTKKQCPAKDMTCFNCGKQNHLSRVCRSKPEANSAKAEPKMEIANVYELNDGENKKVEDDSE